MVVVEDRVEVGRGGDRAVATAADHRRVVVRVPWRPTAVAVRLNEHRRWRRERLLRVLLLRRLLLLLTSPSSRALDDDEDDNNEQCDAAHDEHDHEVVGAHSPRRYRLVVGRRVRGRRGPVTGSAIDVGAGGSPWWRVLRDRCDSRRRRDDDLERAGRRLRVPGGQQEGEAVGDVTGDVRRLGSVLDDAGDDVRVREVGHDSDLIADVTPDPRERLDQRAVLRRARDDVHRVTSGGGRQGARVQRVHRDDSRLPGDDTQRLVRLLELRLDHDVQSLAHDQVLHVVDDELEVVLGTGQVGLYVGHVTTVHVALAEAGGRLVTQVQLAVHGWTGDVVHDLGAMTVGLRAEVGGREGDGRVTLGQVDDRVVDDLQGERMYPDAEDLVERLEPAVRHPEVEGARLHASVLDEHHLAAVDVVLSESVDGRVGVVTCHKMAVTRAVDDLVHDAARWRVGVGGEQLRRRDVGGESLHHFHIRVLGDELERLVVDGQHGDVEHIAEARCTPGRLVGVLAGNLDLDDEEEGVPQRVGVVVAVDDETLVHVLLREARLLRRVDAIDGEDTVGRGLHHHVVDPRVEQAAVRQPLYQHTRVQLVSPHDHVTALLHLEAADVYQLVFVLVVDVLVRDRDLERLVRDAVSVGRRDVIDERVLHDPRVQRARVAVADPAGVDVSLREVRHFRHAAVYPRDQ